MKTLCPQCQETTELTVPVDWQDFGCPHCHTYFKKTADGTLQQSAVYRKPNMPFTFHIGQQGMLDGIRWEVGGMFVKYPVNEPYGWREYTLYSADGKTCFLSESDGHWILATEIETGEKFSFHELDGRTYQGVFYKIFHNTSFETTCAAGFFEHPVAKEGKAKDFIHGQNALLLEQEPGNKTYAFLARHLPEAELRAAFPDTELPARSGRGMLQPFPVDLAALTWILGGAAVLIVLCQLLLTSFFPSYRVLSEHVLLPDSVATVKHVSPSFSCTGIRAPLKMDLSAPVNNSWTGVDFTLVNEDTKEERYGSVEVAYYYGMDQGESWTEGTTRPSYKICGVAPGRYHLVMEVTKAPNRPDLNALHYTITAGSTTFANMFWTVGLLAALIIGAILWQSHFEQQRWMNSDFPPGGDGEG